jgi:hypothetical protein
MLEHALENRLVDEFRRELSTSSRDSGTRNPSAEMRMTGTGVSSGATWDPAGDPKESSFRLPRDCCGNANLAPIVSY